MALEVGVNVIYQSSTETARRDWDAFITYTQQHQPTVNVGGIPTSPTGQATATTFGGGSTIAAPVGSTYGAGFVGAVGNSTTAASNAQASAHAAAAANAQDFISRMNQAPATPPDNTRSVFQMRHPLGPFGGGGTGGYDSRQSMGSQGSPFAEIPPPPGGTPSPAAQAQRYELATTNAAQRGPGGTTAGAGGRMWVPIGETPDIGEIGYGAGRRAMRAMQPAVMDEEGGEEVSGEENDDIGWSYRPGSRSRRQNKPAEKSVGIPSWVGMAATVYAMTSFAGSALGASNQYNIASAGATTLPEMLAAKSANTWSLLNAVPAFGGLLSGIAEANYGTQGTYANQIAQYGLNQTNIGMSGQGINAGLNALGGMRSQLGNVINDPSVVRAGIQNQAIAAVGQAKIDLAVGNFSRDSAIQQLNSDKAAGDWSPEKAENLALLQKQNAIAAAAEQSQENTISVQSRFSVAANQFDVDRTNLGIGYDIDARNRDTAAMGEAGRMHPLTASAMQEISSDRLAVQDFNLAHPGPDFANQRQANTASIIAQQQMSLANLQFQMRIPGKGQEVSGYTMFGDFSNVGYQDAQKALGTSLGGATAIQSSSDSSNKDISDLSANLAALNQTLTTLLNSGLTQLLGAM